MEFNEKLQELRKQKGMTQEELAEALFVSRTAISKWESGRGYPNIESLKAIAKVFSVTVDQLLSGNELLSLAERDVKQKTNNLRDLIFGLLDCSVAVFFFLPLFGQKINGNISEVSLLELTQIQPWLKYSYFAVIIAIIIIGVLTLALQNCTHKFWLQLKGKISLLFNVIGTFLFIISTQPYSAAFLFIYLTIKVFILAKKS